MMMIARPAFYQKFYMYCLLAFLSFFYYVFYFLYNASGVCSMGSGRLAIRASFGCAVDFYDFGFYIVRALIWCSYDS